MGIKAIRNKQREYIISKFRHKLQAEGLSIAGFARREGIGENMFYVRMYDKKRGLNGVVRDAVLRYIKEQ